jgi:hypothetical protein
LAVADDDDADDVNLLKRKCREKYQTTAAIKVFRFAYARDDNKKKIEADFMHYFIRHGRFGGTFLV